MSSWRFDQKRDQMMEKKTKNKKQMPLFFESRFSQGLIFWKRGAKACFDLGNAVITHSFSSLRIGTNFSKRRLFKATKSMSLSLPWTNAKLWWKIQLKDDMPGIPMIVSKVWTRLSLGLSQTSKLFQCQYKGHNSKH